MDRDKISELDGRSWVSLFSKLDSGYYRQELPRKQRVQVRVLHVCLFLISTVLYLLAAAQRFEGNAVWYTVAAEILVLICLFRIMAALITYLTMGQEMPATDHNRSAFALKRTSAWAAVLQVLTCAGTVVYMCKDGEFSAGGIWSACLFAVSAIPMIAMFFVEKNILYTRIAGPDDR